MTRVKMTTLIFALLIALAGIRPAAAEETLDILARDSAGHGLLGRTQDRLVLIVSGTPEQMGIAHGKLLRDKARIMLERTVYLAGGLDSISSGEWFFDRMAEIQRRCGPFVPERFFVECDAMSKAMGVTTRQGRDSNLFPERFHCSGVGVCKSATKDGRVLHVRVLDYINDLNIQQGACVQVFLPEGYNAWMSLGFAGLVGTVTCMNEKGLAIGEMGAGGEGDWDGMPMTFLLRDIMERCSTVDEAVEAFRKTPRTCDYWYVITDAGKNMVGMHATAKEVTLYQPGQQDPRAPFIPKDSVLISGGSRLKHLSDRITKAHGQIDVEALKEIIKRPVAMNANLHDAIFAPETLDMWCAVSGRHTVACDEPYAHVNLGELITFYKKTMAEKTAKN